MEKNEEQKKTPRTAGRFRFFMEKRLEANFPERARFRRKKF